MLNLSQNQLFYFVYMEVEDSG